MPGSEWLLVIGFQKHCPFIEGRKARLARACVAMSAEIETKTPVAARQARKILLQFSGDRSNSGPGRARLGCRGRS